MDSPSPHVVDVDEASFEQAVVARSHQITVVADFWATWCPPCRILTPLLEQLIDGEFAGQLLLAKINSDQAPELMRRFAIRGVPTVIVFRDGQVVERFTGARSEPELRGILAGLQPSPADLLYEQAQTQLAGDEIDRGEATLREAIAADPHHAQALLALGKILEQRRDTGEALSLYAGIRGSDAAEAEAKRRTTRIEFQQLAAAAGSRSELEARLERTPDDLDARLAVAYHHAEAGEFREALEHLLALVERDRKFQDEVGRRTMITIFELIGVRSPLADEFRTKLSRMLY